MLVGRQREQQALGRVEREHGVGVVPRELPGRRRAGGRARDAEAARRGWVHGLVEADIDLLPRAAVDPVRVRLDRIDRRRDRRERPAVVVLQHAIRRGGEALCDPHLVRRRRREVRRDKAVDRRVEPFAGPVKRGLEHDYRIGALRRERRERRDGAVELDEDLRGGRDLGVTVAWDHLLHDELAGDRELPARVLRQAGILLLIEQLS